jgi:hypothetical protein
MEVTVQLYELLAPLVTVRHMLTPLEQATTFPAETKQDHAVRILSREKFDGAPVIGPHGVLGHVLLAELEAESSRPLVEQIHPIGPGTILSGDSALGEAMRWLVESPFLFVLTGRDISGLITRSDISKQPGRLHFFLLLMDFELSLSGVIRHLYRDDQTEIYDLLSPQRAATLKERFVEEQEQDTESDRVAFLDFSHLLDVGYKDARIRERFGIESSSEWRRKTGGLNKLRNDIMHPTRQSLLNSARSLQKLINYEERLTDLLSEAPRFAIPEGLFGLQNLEGGPS